MKILHINDQQRTALASAVRPTALRTIALIAVLLLAGCPTTPVLSVPNVIGLSQSAAETTLRNAGYGVGSVSFEANAAVSAGTVLRQSPTGGTNAAAGTLVSLVLSSGANVVTVPGVVGFTRNVAESLIVAAGLSVGNVTQAASTSVPAGSVISQNPQGNTSVAAGSAVSLVISSGANVVTVPGVVGFTRNVAESLIVAAGLSVGTVTQAASSTVPAGSVISQNPQGNTSVATGSAVSLVVSTGAQSQAPVANFSATPQSGAAPLQVQFTDTSQAGSSAITSWAWQFGNGVTSSQRNPQATYQSPGSYTVSLTVGSAAGQNTATRTAYIVVQATSTPIDLAIDEVFLAVGPEVGAARVTSPQAGQQVYLHMEYCYTGTQPLEGKLREIKLDGVSRCIGIVRLAEESCYVGICPDPWTVTAGSHTLEAILDPDSLFTESNENNNRASIQFTVTPVSTPADFAMQEIFLATGATNDAPRVTTPQAGQQVYLHMRYCYTGTSPIEGKIREVRLNGSVFCTRTFLLEATGCNIVGICSDPWTATVGAHTFEAILDPDNAFAETNENNNRASIQFTVTPVSASADFAMQEVYLASGSATNAPRVTSPQAGQQVYLHMKYCYTGPSPVEGKIREVRLDGSVFCTRTFLLDATGCGIIGVCPDPWTATAGAHSLEAILDPDNAFAETNENNNRSTLQFTVQSGGGQSSWAPVKSISREFHQLTGGLQWGTLENANPTQLVADGAGNWNFVFATTDTFDSNPASGFPNLGSDFDIIAMRSTNNLTSWISRPVVVNTHAVTDNATGSSDNFDKTPGIAGNGQGRWVAVWTSEYDPTGANPSFYHRVYSSVSTDNGATWNTPREVNGLAANETNDGFYGADIAYAGGNSWIIVWTGVLDFGNNRNYYNISNDGGNSWSAPQPIAGTTNLPTYALPFVLCDDNGNCRAAWTRGFSNDVIQTGLLISGQASFAAQATQFDTDLAKRPGYALATNNERWILVWEMDDPSVAADSDIWYAYVDGNGTAWSTPRPLQTDAATDSKADSMPTIAAVGDTWIAVWKSNNTATGLPTGVAPHIRYSVSTNNGMTWSAPKYVVSNHPAGASLNVNGLFLASDGRETFTLALVAAAEYADADLLSFSGLFYTTYKVAPVAAQQFSLTTAVDGAGTLSVDPQQSQYEEGDSVVLTGNPDEGWEFVAWEGTAPSAQNPLSLTMNQDHSVTAVFDEEVTPGGDYSQATFATGRSPFDGVVADVNRDGHPDVITANNFDRNVTVLLGNGDGTFQAAVSIADEPDPERIRVADINKDGNPDLIIGNPGSDSLTILPGNGDATFQAEITVAVGNAPVGFATADFNKDGAIDLAVTNYEDDTISLLLGNGDFTFNTLSPLAADPNPMDVVAADFNGDGNLDIAACCRGGNSAAVFLGDGAGNFAAPQTISVHNGPTSLAAADLDSDGKLDLVTANIFGNSASVAFGNGQGGFETAQALTTGTGPLRVVIADVNQDSRLDIVTANYASNTISILAGNGGRTFAPRQDIPVGNEPVSIAAADLDGDSRPEIITVNAVDSTISVLTRH